MGSVPGSIFFGQNMRRRRKTVALWLRQRVAPDKKSDGVAGRMPVPRPFGAILSGPPQSGQSAPALGFRRDPETSFAAQREI